MKIGHRPRDRLIVRSGMRKDNVYEQSTHFALMLRNPDDHQASNDFPRHLLLDDKHAPLRAGGQFAELPMRVCLLLVHEATSRTVAGSYQYCL